MGSIKSVFLGAVLCLGALRVLGGVAAAQPWVEASGKGGKTIFTLGTAALHQFEADLDNGGSYVSAAGRNALGNAITAMHEIAARALTLAHPTLRCGVPHFREKRYIPIRTSAHLIVFDAERMSCIVSRS